MLWKAGKCSVERNIPRHLKCKGDENKKPLVFIMFDFGFLCMELNSTSYATVDCLSAHEVLI